MLEVKEHANRTISWWFARRSRIDFSPEYQRKGSIWALPDRAYLIDSILNNYDLPKIYLADFTYRESPLSRSDKQYAVIDGKQRLLSIFEFLDNKLALSPTFSLKRNPELDLRKLYYKDLKGNPDFEEIAGEFDNFNLTVMSVLADTESEISDLFDRLNRSKPLTGPEKRNAYSSRVNIYIRRLAAHEFFTDRISFSTVRLQDLDLAARLLLLEASSRPVDLKKRNLDRFVKDYDERSERLLEAIYASACAGLDLLNLVFGTSDQLLSTPGQVPLYFLVAKSLSEDELDRFRARILRFEELRSLARKRAQATSEESRKLLPEFEDLPDILSAAKIVEFNQASRNINDGSSLTTRVGILTKFVRDLSLGSAPKVL